jgi:uncharacterized small protein (DUF1192 family)
MDDNHPRKLDTPQFGEDLYGLSVSELEQRINAYREEIARLERELAKKSAERSAADALFGKGN